MTIAMAQFNSILRFWGATPGSLQNLEGEQPAIEAWYKKFVDQINQSRLGYPTATETHSEPVLERELLAIAARLGIHVDLNQKQPTVCLSHDVDYFRPTVQLMIKEVVGRRKWRKYFSSQRFIESYQRLLETDKSYLTNKGPTTFFASPVKSKNPFTRYKQWIVDPSYSWTSKDGEAFAKLVSDFDVEVGIHGSICSLSKNTFSKEVENLSQVFAKPVRIARQHWLHLPNGIQSLAKMRAGNIGIDSTLGWNGHAAFRAGMCRPYPIYLGEGLEPLVEVPLVIMDGVFFDELKLSGAQAFARITEILAKVRDAKGTVALNWHDRSAHEGYGWFQTYKQILDWCRAEGFQFTNISGAVDDYVATV
jgi:hypothetical protein